MHDAYDRSSKWLIDHHGDALLRLGGVSAVRSWRPLQAELVQPRQLPDGLLEVDLADEPEPVHFLVEVGTYPERRLLDQVVRDLTLVFLDRRKLPEVLTIILQPKGQYRVTSPHELTSRLNWTRLQFSWRVVELWKLSAGDLLAANDVGLVPWVPLTQFTETPAAILTECGRRIAKQANAQEHANLLAVTQVLARLRYNDAGLLSLLGGRKVMIESPLIQELLAEQGHDHVMVILVDRFGSVPQNIDSAVHGVQDTQKLRELVVWASRCPDLDSFLSRLPAT